jgi:hypothetical protein
MPIPQEKWPIPQEKLPIPEGKKLYNLSRYKHKTEILSNTGT